MKIPIQCVFPDCKAERHRNWFLCLDHIYLYVGLSVQPEKPPVPDESAKKLVEKLKTIATKA